MARFFILRTQLWLFPLAGWLLRIRGAAADACAGQRVPGHCAADAVLRCQLQPLAQRGREAAHCRTKLQQGTPCPTGERAGHCRIAEGAHRKGRALGDSEGTPRVQERQRQRQRHGALKQCSDGLVLWYLSLLDGMAVMLPRVLCRGPYVLIVYCTCEGPRAVAHGLCAALAAAVRVAL